MTLNIDKDKWLEFIKEGIGYNFDTGIRHDIDYFIQEIDEDSQSLDWRAFPLIEIVSRKWVDAKKKEVDKNPQKIFDTFLALIGTEEIPQKVLLRKTLHKNTKKLMNDYALLSWCIRILNRGVNTCCPNKYNPDVMNSEFFREIAQFSRLDDGPLRVKDFLAEYGIALIVEKPLAGSIFNGAAIMSKSGMPIVGMTLYYDRIDNFWFTLLHELAHVWKHLHSDNDLYIDFFGGKGEDRIDSLEENEADKIARESLIPSKYITHNAFVTFAEEAVIQLADELKIHPSIIAGRIRHDNNAWNMLSNLVNKTSVRSLFNDSGW